MTVQHNQTLTATTSITPGDREFGFLEQKGERDAFITIAMLQRAGFNGQLSVADVVNADVTVLPDGKRRAEVVHAINGKSADGKPYVPVPTERRVEVGRKMADGGTVDFVVMKVTTIASGDVKYEVRCGAVDGKVYAQRDTLADAREVAGIVITPPQVVGGKTNVPDQGPAKGRSGEQGSQKSGQKKKKAA